VTFEAVAEALVEGFARALKLELEQGELSAHEWDVANLFRAKYAGDEWTFAK
jgi:lipoate-protein ligase A